MGFGSGSLASLAALAASIAVAGARLLAETLNPKP